MLSESGIEPETSHFLRDDLIAELARKKLTETVNDFNTNKI